MNIEDIVTEWKEDAKYDRLELGEEALRCSNLHSKYMEIYYKEQSIRIKLQNDLNIIRKERWEYWNGKLDEKTIRDKGWEPQPLTILKSDITIYLETDEYVSRLNMRVQLQEEKIKIVDQIIKHIANRGFNIKSAIAYEQFKSGM